jgi:hypothetical protein
MGSRPNFNMQDPAQQDKIRRGTHYYDEVNHRYIPIGPPGTNQGYLHQEYPKVMDKTPCPQLADFKGQPNAEILLEQMRREWDERQMHSVVKNKDEEEKWIESHKGDVVLTAGAYPKTMDRTPAPKAEDCDGLEDYRLKRQAWKDQVAASIVHDESEEQLWLIEHDQTKVEAKPKKRARAA